MHRRPHKQLPSNTTPILGSVIALAGLLIVFSSLFLSGISRTTPLYAGASQNVSGFAWSPNIGYISFNCLDRSGASSPQQNTCATTDYGVNIDFGTGNLSGFAWSSNIGYINFAPTPDAATGCTASPCAKLDLVTNNVNGFARACGVLSAVDCSGTAMKGASVLGGWDGWIKLTDPSWTNPANYGYLGSAGTAYDAGAHHGIYFDPVASKLKGFAWGGLVVGWMDFAAVVPPAVGGVVITAGSAPGIAVTPVQLDFSDTEINTTKTLAFTITNTGVVGTFLSGTITMPAGTPFTLSSGSSAVVCATSVSCTYTAIPPGTPGLVNVTFAPTSLGSGQTTQITFDSTDASIANVVKTVLGNGVYLVSGSGLSFGNVVVNRTKDLVLTITNSGSVNLGSNSLTFPFPVYTCLSGCPFNLPPGGSANVTIRFQPTAIQAYNGNAFLTAYPTITFPFTGTGVSGSFKFKDQ